MFKKAAAKKEPTQLEVLEQRVIRLESIILQLAWTITPTFTQNGNGIVQPETAKQTQLWKLMQDTGLVQLPAEPPPVGAAPPAQNAPTTGTPQ